MKLFLSLLLVLCLVLSFGGCAQPGEPVPGPPGDPNSSAAPADAPQLTLTQEDLFSDRDYTDTWSNETTIDLSTAANPVRITTAGTYLVSGQLDGQIIIDIPKDAKVQLVLHNAHINCAGSAAVYIPQGDKVFLTLAPGTDNSLTSTGEFTNTEGDGVDAAIFSRSDLAINGSGKLTVTCQTGHGIVSKDDLRITGGDFTVTSAKQALGANDRLTIAGGKFALTAGTDALHCENTEDAALGIIAIFGGEWRITAQSDGLDGSGTVLLEDGTVEITAQDDGLHSEADLFVTGGRLNILACYEGLEGKTVTVAGGTTTILASDDGINATSGSTSSNGGGFWGNKGENPFAVQEGVGIFITGGSLTVNAGGDGIDSNGSLSVTGGTTYVFGSESSGNGALDYASSATITGGTFLACGGSGMAMNFSGGSQCAAMVNLSGSGQLTLTDSQGNTLLTATPTKRFSSVVVSTPEMTVGGSYKLACGSASAEFTMSSTLYGSAGVGGMGGMGGGGMGGNQRPNGGGHQRPNGSGQRPNSGEQAPSLPNGGFHGPVPTETGKGNSF